MTMLRLNATAVAVLTALTLTACGGGTTLTNSAKSAPEHWLAPKPVTPATTTATATNENAQSKPNSDSDQFTNFAPITDWGTATPSGEFSREYFTARTRDNLHTDIENAYGKRFETTFKYNTQITDGNSSITGKVYRNHEAIPLDQLGNGHRIYTMKETAETHIDGVKYSGDRTSRIQLYQQPNSIVLGRQTLSGSISDGQSPKTLSETPLRLDYLSGKAFTQVSKEQVDAAKSAYDNALSSKQAAEKAYKEIADQAVITNAPGNTAVDPAQIRDALIIAKTTLDAANTNLSNTKAVLDSLSSQYDIFAKGLEFNYKGEAFNQNSIANANKGRLEYAINFNTRTGHGKITGLDTGTINLNNANMGTVAHTNADSSQASTLGIQGVANFADGRADGKYTLGIFGNEAEEVAGFVTEDNVNTVGFGGTRK